MLTHYIAMAGLHGCMPNSCHAYESLEGALSDLVQLHDLGRHREAVLQRDRYLELNLRRDGNEYAEIAACDCDDMEVHNDS